MFEIGWEALGHGNPKVMKASLLGKLRGAAAAWVQGRNEELVHMSYEELKEKLCIHFQGETMGHVRTLQRLRQGNTPLDEFNQKFSTTAAPALASMSEMQVKDIYLQSLASSKTRQAIATCMHKPLQQLMQRALDFNFALEMEDLHHPRHNKPSTTTPAN